MSRILFWTVNIWFITTACSSSKINAAKSMPEQGIEGYVYWLAGNQMPSPDRKPSVPKGIRTTVYIYPLTNINQVTRLGHTPFYTAINTKLVSTVDTDSNGYFKLGLNPGHYSLFIKKGDLFFANGFDKDNNIAPTEVLAGKMTKVDFTVDYDAVY